MDQQHGFSKISFIICEIQGILRDKEEMLREHSRGRRDMEKKLKDYITYIEALLTEPEAEDAKERKLQRAERKRTQKDMLVQIGFFQHERLIHLIVTVTFALLTVGSLIAGLFVQQLSLYCLTVLFLVLLIPYIRHYYILENGVQKLYALYEEMK